MRKLLCFLPLCLIFLISCVTTDVYDKEEVSLIQNNIVLSTETKTLKNGKQKGKVIIYNQFDEYEEDDDGVVYLQKTNEKVTVESKTNGEFVAYTFLGKPFVILGCSVWELLKCCGYSFANFMGGYNSATGGNYFWIKPDVKKYKEQCNAALDANKVKVYPEYHKPFTNNKIVVSKMTSTAGSTTISENEMEVISVEEHEYDNTLSVEKSAQADAYATYSVVGVIGAAITVPVSAVMWVTGAIYGFADSK